MRVGDGLNEVVVVDLERILECRIYFVETRWLLMTWVCIMCVGVLAKETNKTRSFDISNQWMDIATEGGSEDRREV